MAQGSQGTNPENSLNHSGGDMARDAGQLAKAAGSVIANPSNPMAWAKAFKSVANILKKLFVLWLFLVVTIGTVFASLILSFNGANPQSLAMACGEAMTGLDADGQPIMVTTADNPNSGGVSVNSDPSTLSAAARRNAQIIIGVGKSRGLPDQAMVVALATAMQESNLLNINYGDRDSVGLFQQRPSQGWGTVQQIMNAQYSATKFYQTLETVANWEALPVTVAAQKVQRSGFPLAYAKWESLARNLYTSLTGTVAENASLSYGGTAASEGANAMINCISTMGASSGLMPGEPVCVLTQTSYVKPRQGPCTANDKGGIEIRIPNDKYRAAAINFAFAQLGKPYLWAGTGPNAFDCSGLTMRAIEAGGAKISRTAAAQYADKRVTKVFDEKALTQGDLVFFSYGGPGTIDHVGMYLGNHMMIAAPSTGDRVKIQRIYGGKKLYWGKVNYPKEVASTGPVVTLAPVTPKAA